MFCGLLVQPAEEVFPRDNDASAELKRREICTVGELVRSGSGNAKDGCNVCHVHHQGQFFQRVILFLVHLSSFLPFRESKFVFEWPRRIVQSEIYVLVKYLNTLLPDNWNSMDLYERRNFLTNSTSAKGTVQRKTVSNAEIWSECFCRNLSDLKPSDSYAIAALMTKVDGWERTEKIRKLAIYGRQRIYERL